MREQYVLLLSEENLRTGRLDIIQSMIYRTGNFRIEYERDLGPPNGGGSSINLYALKRAA